MVFVKRLDVHFQIGVYHTYGFTLWLELVDQKTELFASCTWNLEDLVQKYGAAKVQAFEFDITKLEDIEKFEQKITSTHPDLD